MPDVENQEQQSQQPSLEDILKENQAMKSKMQELLSETKKAKEQYREIHSKYEQTSESIKKKAQETNDFEQLYRSSEAERTKFAQELQSMREHIAREKVSRESLRVATELADGENAELLSEFIQRRIRYVDDEIKIVDNNGALTVSTLDDLKKEFQTSGRYSSLIRGSRANGGGATGAKNRVDSSGKTLTRSEFDSLPPDSRMAFIKSGGRIFD